MVAGTGGGEPALAGAGAFPVRSERSPSAPRRCAISSFGTLMTIAITAVALLVTAGFCWLAAWMLGRTSSPRLALLLIVVAALGWAGVAQRDSPGEAEVGDRPIQVAADGYVSSRTCRSCHSENYASWRSSYHSSMTQVVSPASMVAESRRLNRPSRLT